MKARIAAPSSAGRGGITDILRAMFTARGRIGRRAFWLQTTGAWIVFWMLYAALDAVDLAALSRIPALALLAALLNLCSRRYHDLDRSGRRLLLLAIPLFGLLWVCIELGGFRGTTGPNRYGPDPRDESDPHARGGRDYATVTSHPPEQSSPGTG